MRPNRIIAIIVCLIGLLLGLASLPASAQDVVPIATKEPLPTYTPYPTQTPYPTYTPYPEPTLISIAPAPLPPAPRPIPGFSADTMAAIDKQINDIQLQLEILQSARLAANAPLLQLPPTHKQPVDLDATKSVGQAPDLRRRIGIDSWYSARLDLPTELMADLRVDVYQGPDGPGFVVMAETIHNGIVWRRAVNVGPESWRESDWIASK